MTHRTTDTKNSNVYRCLA